MSQMHRAGSRPTAVKAYTFLMLLGAVFMALLGWSASAYYVPALCLLITAMLLWFGRSYGLFRWILLLNQVSALVLILVLWLGDGLGERKLDVSGAMLLVNLLCGGPLLAVLGALILPSLRRGKGLFHWFNPRWA